jgi:hypothetical protein
VRLYYEPWKKSSLYANQRELAGQAYLTWKSIEYVATFADRDPGRVTRYRLTARVWLNAQGRDGNDNPPVFPPVLRRHVQDHGVRQSDPVPGVRVLVPVRWPLLHALPEKDPP